MIASYHRLGILFWSDIPIWFWFESDGWRMGWGQIYSVWQFRSAMRARVLVHSRFLRSAPFANKLQAGALSVAYIAHAPRRHHSSSFALCSGQSPEGSESVDSPRSSCVSWYGVILGSSGYTRWRAYIGHVMGRAMLLIAVTGRTRGHSPREVRTHPTQSAQRLCLSPRASALDAPGKTFRRVRRKHWLKQR